MNWEQYSKRRGGMSLQDFLSGCKSEDEALKRFLSKKVDPPTELLKSYFQPQVQNVTESTVLEQMKENNLSEVTAETEEELQEVPTVSETSFSKKSKVSGGKKGN